jgi:hypothetical protein
MGKARRLELQAKLEATLGSNLVYFQPGPNVTLNYPCIVYERDNASAEHADNIKYTWMQRYQVTYLDYSPDSDVLDKLMEYPYSEFNRHFATSGLNHDVYTIYH